jgi:protein-tyrosine phosphatase
MGELKPQEVETQLTSTSTKSSANIPQVTFEQVVKTSQLISEFRDILDDANGVHNVEFIESVLVWQQELAELQESSQQSEYQKLLYEKSHSIHTQFISKDSAGDNLINVPDELRKDLTLRIVAMCKKGVDKMDQTQIHRDMFGPLVAAAQTYVGEQIWPDFAQSDDYSTLCQIYAEQLENSTSNTRTTATSNAGTEQAHSVGVPVLSSLYPSRSTPFLNEGFQTLSLTVMGGRGSMIQSKGANNLALVAGAGSRMYMGQRSPGKWGETFLLPVTDTLQYAFVCVVQSGKTIGFLPLPLCQLQEQAAKGLATQPRWFPMRTVDNPGPLSLPDGVTEHDTPTASTVSSSGTNEVCITWRLSSDPCPPAMERMKTVVSDETVTGVFGDFIRGKVSKKKKRFTDDNFNLDLTYITPQVIAMGFPSEGREGIYRNPLKQVQQFFTLRHPHAYRIYNLCSERSYDGAKFENCCEHHPFDDHNPPPFRLLKEFCESVRTFLSQSPQNVVSVHCKAGKGRTGTCIASYFVYSGMGSAQQALELFGRKRTSNSKGVTIPSQIRYVHYFDKYCRLRREDRPSPGRTTLFLEKVILHNIGRGSGSDLHFTVLQPNKFLEDDGTSPCRRSEERSGPFPCAEGQEAEKKPKSYSSRKLAAPSYYKQQDNFVWDLRHRVLDLSEDFRIELYGKSGLSREKLFQCWLNTRFMVLERVGNEMVITIPKADLDKACKDKNHKKYGADMYLQLVFANGATATRIKRDELNIK